MKDVLLFTDVNGIAGWGRYGGTYKIATELRKAGFTVQTIDVFGEWSVDELKQLIDKFVNIDTLYVGFSNSLMVKQPTDRDYPTACIGTNLESISYAYAQMFSHSNSEMEDLFKYIKGKGTKIVVGGSKSIYSQSFNEVDYWVVGEGDVSGVVLAQSLKAGKEFKTIDGKILLENDYLYLDAESSEIVWDESDFLFPQESLPMEFARGCPFKCSFCRAPNIGRKLGTRTVKYEVLRNQFLRNYENFGTVDYMISDSLTNETTEKIINLHKAITSLPFELELSAHFRLDLLSKNKFERELIKEMGIRVAFFGIETFHPVAAKIIGKHFPKEKTIEDLNYLKEGWKDRVRMRASFIVGLPGEPEESIWETFKWCISKDCPLDGFSFYPLSVGDPDRFSLRTSMFDSSPEKFGIRKIKYRVPAKFWDWETDQMTYSRANEICKEMAKDMITHNPISETFLGRIINLGYTLDDIINRTYNSEEFTPRRKKLVEAYKHNIMVSEK